MRALIITLEQNKQMRGNKNLSKVSALRREEPAKPRKQSPHGHEEFAVTWIFHAVVIRQAFVGNDFIQDSIGSA